MSKGTSLLYHFERNFSTIVNQFSGASLSLLAKAISPSFFTIPHILIGLSSLDFKNEISLKNEIKINIEEDPTYVTVSVKDRGIGIAAENLETIFDKFSTVPSAGIGKPEGTGLGLAICKAIIESHGGKIWAESVQGESSTFYFTLRKKQS